MKYTIKDAETGREFIGRDDESIFRAMHKSGRSIFKGGCEGGGCGICKVKILEGEYVAFKKLYNNMDLEKAQELNAFTLETMRVLEKALQSADIKFQ